MPNQAPCQPKWHVSCNCKPYAAQPGVQELCQPLPPAIIEPFQGLTIGTVLATFLFGVAFGCKLRLIQPDALGLFLPGKAPSKFFFLSHGNYLASGWPKKFFSHHSALAFVMASIRNGYALPSRFYLQFSCHSCIMGLHLQYIGRHLQCSASKAHLKTSKKKNEKKEA